MPSSTALAQRVHVTIWYILEVQRGSHTATLGLKYLIYSYIEPLGSFHIRACFIGAQLSLIGNVYRLKGRMHVVFVCF